MASECPKYLDSNPSSPLASRSRCLLTAVLAASALNMNGCSDDAVSFPPPPKGWGCVSVLDQSDKPMTDCSFGYEVPKEGRAAGNCSNGELFVYGAPGLYKVNAECGKLAGHVEADIDEGANTTKKTHLIGSICTDGQEIVADRLHKIVELNDRLGSSSATHCDNWLTNPQLEKMEVVGIKLDCNEGTDAGAPDAAADASNIDGGEGGSEAGVDGGMDAGTEAGTECDPISGRNYLEPLGTPGQYSDGKPINVMFNTAPELVPDGKSVTINVTLRQMEGAHQEIVVPIIIRSSSQSPATQASDAGSEASSDAGAE